PGGVPSLHQCTAAALHFVGLKKLLSLGQQNQICGDMQDKLNTLEGSLGCNIFHAVLCLHPNHHVFLQEELIGFILSQNNIYNMPMLAGRMIFGHITGTTLVCFLINAQHFL
ncbi:hypothetical protein ACJX0J_020084, partial [Zea mays]